MDEIVFQQALFGYEDGHRLLQSSFRPNSYEKDLLLQLSDLAPGISTLREDGYWTGMPLRETSRYAVLRTWPAPEKSRPGCVWTHAIFIPFEYLHSEANLLWITSYFKRPESQKRFNEYAEPISAIWNSSGLPTRTIPQASQLVSCIYFAKCLVSKLLTQDELGMQAIAVWAQQWPELRTAFNFRTVEKSSAGRSWLLNFDMMLTDGNLRLQQGASPSTIRSFNESGEVEEVLAADLSGIETSVHRRLRDAYSADLPLHPVWTAFLTSIQMKLREAIRRPKSAAYQCLLQDVAAALPEQSIGLRLKNALIDFTSTSQLEIPFEFGSAVIEFFAHGINASRFPKPLFSDEALRWIWKNDQTRLFDALTQLEASRSDIADYVFAEFARSIPTDQLMTETGTVPVIRRAMVAIRPELLRWEGLANLPNNEIVELLGLLPAGDVRELGVVPRLIFTGDSSLARFLCERFPEEVVFSVCIGGSHVTHRRQPHEIILRFVGDVASRYVGANFVSRLTTTTALLSFAAMLGFVSEVTVSAGPEIWGVAVRTATEDSSGADLQTLQAFAFSLAVATARSGAELLMEFSFEPLHEAMRKSRLDYQASVIVGPHLPDVGWWYRWDNCYRLRVATIRAYAFGNLPSQSFLHLSKDEALMSALFHDLESNDEFRGFLERLRSSNAGA